jgi:hypothetical protein
MSNYTKITDFAAKDALITGNPLKKATGTQIGAELDAISTAISTKADYNSPTLVTPALGTPASGILTNCTGLVPATGLSSVTGTGAAVLATSPTLVTPALGTPASGVLTNCTGTAAGLTVGNATNATNATGSAVVTGSIGYAIGAGGSVTQATDITTAVTLNKISGQIITQTQAWVANTTYSFTFNNTSIGVNDTVLVNEAAGGTTGLIIKATNIQANRCAIRIMIFGGISGTGPAYINFAVIKAVNA